MNHLTGLADLLAAWDGQSDTQGRVPARSHGLRGEINLDGSPTCPSAEIVPRSSPWFEDMIEPGVRSLVLCLTDTCRVVTYSSCEGHPPAQGGRAPFRQVGILPRDREYRGILVAVTAAARIANAKVESAARVTVIQRDLTSDAGTRRCLDVVFLPTSGIEDWYYTTLEPIYNCLVRLLPASFALLSEEEPA